MNDFFSYLIPILFLVNSFFIGKLVQKKYISMNNALSFASGSILLFSGLSIIDIIFLFAGNLASFFPFAVLIFQIVLVILYLINWKKSIFSLLPNWNKLLTFIFIFFALSISYFLFIYSNNRFIFWLNIQQNFSIFWKSFSKLLDFVKISQNSINNNLYKIWLPVFLLFISTACVYDFLNITNEFSWKKYLIGFFVSIVFGFLIFNNISIIKNGYSLLFIYSIILLSFFTSKLDDNDISNYQFVFNSLIIFFILLDSTLLFYLIIIYVWFALFLYAKKIDFSLDMLARASLYLLCSVSFFFIGYLNNDFTFSIVFFSIIFIVFLCLISLYLVTRKNNENYFYKTFIWENKFHPTVRYINLIIFLLISIITIILVLQQTISFDATNFNFASMFWPDNQKQTSKSFLKAITIIFYIFYSIVLFYSVVNFFIKLKLKKVVSNSFFLTNITLILMNPLFICLLNSLPIQNKSFINTYLLFAFYLFFVFAMFSKKILYLSNSDFKKMKNTDLSDHWQINFLNLNITKKTYLLNTTYIFLYVFLAVFFVSSFLVFSFI